MSELMYKRNVRGKFSRHLWTTASTLALINAVCALNESHASDQDAQRPTVWIELGGEAEHISGQGDAFAPPFLAIYADSEVLGPTTPLGAQSPPPFSFAAQGKISLQPQNSDWVFAASVNFGRSSNFKEVDHQTKKTVHTYYHNGMSGGQLLTSASFADTRVHRRESHAIVDFSAGKDVGLGMFGGNASSVVAGGVRFAQFSTREAFDIRARPDLRLKYYPSAHAPTRLIGPYFHSYHATGQSSRNFHGLGPSISWSTSAPFAGNAQDGEVIIDWGVNVAILFGKQKSSVQHMEIGNYQSPGAQLLGGAPVQIYQHSNEGHAADRSVTVPNMGGFAAASYRIEDFKVSAGYRADFFFGAIDGGIDSRASKTLGFYGPFATISIGLGG